MILIVLLFILLFARINKKTFIKNKFCFMKIDMLVKKNVQANKFFTNHMIINKYYPRQFFSNKNMNNNIIFFTGKTSYKAK